MVQVGWQVPISLFCCPTALALASFLPSWSPWSHPSPKAMSWKSLSWAETGSHWGGGQTKGWQIKAGGLSTGWPGTRDRGLTRPRSQQEGFSPSW